MIGSGLTVSLTYQAIRVFLDLISAKTI